MKLMKNRILKDGKLKKHFAARQKYSIRFNDSLIYAKQISWLMQMLSLPLPSCILNVPP